MVVSSSCILLCNSRLPTEQPTFVCQCAFSKARQILFQEWHVDPLIPFKPVSEPAGIHDVFLPAEPLQLLQQGTHTIPWLTGINSGDGALKAAR
jgi:hypothetical protein